MKDPQGIRLLYSNFEQREDYPFLVWNANKSQNMSKRMSIYQFLISQLNISDDKYIEMDRDDEISNPEIRKTCVLKVAAIKCMIEYLEQELSVNNLRHVAGVVNNSNHLFTILNDIEKAWQRQLCEPTWRGSTPWTLFLQ
ncbi:5777_t:CDS:1 [Acaulospora morrowiae]|uniref:5777_t:CDS:1 n=1 Tax=Acaulospora morrowiae TaxID=94023 RepID=A0A9N9ESV7_9GLOM|nr:5777_t:CDS:1 [Acaulospora morrowiae]